MRASRLALLQGLANPYLLLTLTALFWSGNWVLGRGMRADVPPVALAFWRWSLALCLTLPWAWRYRSQIGTAWRSHRVELVWLSLLGISGYNTLAYLGLRWTTATNGVLLNSFIPVVIIALSWALLGQRLSGRQLLGVGVSLGGVLVVVAHGDLARLAALSLNAGDLWILASVLVWAAYTLLLRRRPPALHPMALLAVLTALGTAALVPLYAWELWQGARIRPSTGALLGIVYTGVFPAFLGYVFWNQAVAQVGGSVAGLFIHLMPIFTPLLAALFLGEQPKAYHALGLLLILGGIILGSAVQPGVQR